MSDFKVGDDAWYFHFPEDGCGGGDVQAVELHVIKNLPQSIIDFKGRILDAYKTKQDAIDAFKKRLDEL